jgi:hypothetical protein
MTECCGDHLDYKRDEVMVIWKKKEPHNLNSPLNIIII